MEDFQVQPIELSTGSFKVNALRFIPKNPSNQFKAIFTHGYTASKSSILTWGSRFAGTNFETIIFDLPGHYLGSFNEVNDFEEFKTKTPDLFVSAFELFKETPETLILGGHSLGALMSLKALENNFTNTNTLNLCVGLGLGPQDSIHAFDSDFYKKTFAFREQLTSPAIRGETILPWIRDKKSDLSITDKTIHFITGKDDVVVAQDGTERMAEELRSKGNTVTINRPNRMSHHQPDLAGPHLMAYLRENYNL